MERFLVKFLVMASVCSSLVAGINSLVFADSVQRELFSQANNCQNLEPNLQKYAQLITAKVLIGRLWGSGVLIKEKSFERNTNYTILTNGHVLLQVKAPYLIQTSDGETYKANLLGKFDNPDLALLQFTSVKKYPVASLKPAFTLASLQKEDEVFAAGYPVDASKGFVVEKGNIAVLLPQAMSDGYQIGFLADIVQGMSGGALLNCQGEVVGIIGKSSYPVNGFPKAYQFDNNFQPTLFPKELMENSSWAIPIEIAANKWYSELSPNLAWNMLYLSKKPAVSSNIAKPSLLSDLSLISVQSRNQISAPQNSVVINEQKTPESIVDIYQSNRLQTNDEKWKGIYRLRIWKYQNNELIEVTNFFEYQQIHRNYAQAKLNYYLQNKDYLQNSPVELQSLLGTYLVSKYLANELNDGWKNVKDWYSLNDREQYFQHLNYLLSQI